MEYTADVELILNSLNKDRKELADKINDIDKLIKKIKYGNINLGGNQVLSNSNVPEIANDNDQPKPFPLKADLKVQVLKVIDILGEATKLKTIQDKYKEISGLQHNLRETLRILNKHGILKLLQPKGTQRGLYWVKTDWLEDNGTKLKDKYKFDGFDLLFSDETLEYK